MSRLPATTAAKRRSFILTIIQQPLLREEIRKALRPVPSPRTLASDLAWLRAQFPGRLLTENDGRALRWRFVGEAPRLIEKPIVALDEDQVAALIAARGLLRQPDASRPSAEDDGTAYHGVLSRAIDRLLHDSGIADEARSIAPDAIAISRFGVAPEEDAAFPICFSAIRAGEALVFTYTNNSGTTHPVHAQPVRMLHIAGEWHCMAWAADAAAPPGRLKQYRLSRLTGARRVSTPPAGCPVSGLRDEAAAELRDAFRATGSARLASRRTVVLGVSSTAWPFIERRRWGDKQVIDDRPAGLPGGWRRLRFVTTGLAECRYWVLSFGAEVRVEAPDELATWVASQARIVLDGIRATRPGS